MISPRIEATTNGAVTGNTRAVLRAEGAILFASTILFFLIADGSWQLFALLFFAPDLGLLGYLAGPKAGAFAYNALHSTIGPLLLVLTGVVLLWPLAGPLAMIWLAHIGFDRALGLGLKYGDGIRLTHLGRLGKASAAEAN